MSERGTRHTPGRETRSRCRDYNERSREKRTPASGETSCRTTEPIYETSQRARASFMHKDLLDYTFHFRRNMNKTRTWSREKEIIIGGYFSATDLRAERALETRMKIKELYFLDTNFFL